MSRTLARRLDRIEAKLNPPNKPRITVIVVGAGEEIPSIYPSADGFVLCDRTSGTGLRMAGTHTR
jgi:hypothetical protein